MTMDKEPKMLIRSVVREIIDQKVYSLFNELDTNEFRDEVVDELYDHEVLPEEDYELVNGEDYDMNNEFTQKLIDYLTDKYVSRFNITNENW